MSILFGLCDENGIFVLMMVDEFIVSMKVLLLKKIKCLVYVYCVDCGGCNGCEIEIFVIFLLLFDVECFGIKVVFLLCYVDILLFIGVVICVMCFLVLCVWQLVLDLKICIFYGVCGNSGGIFYDLYCVWGGIDKIVLVDVYILGCLLMLVVMLYGFVMVFGLLEQKIYVCLLGEFDEQLIELLYVDMVQFLWVCIDCEVWCLVGYCYGWQIVDDYMCLFGQGDSQVLCWLEVEKDLCLIEIVIYFNQVVEGVCI